VATRRAKPVLASHAERARRNIGVERCAVAPSWRAHRVRPINNDNIIPSKQIRADRRRVRWRVKPTSARRKADEKARCVEVIKQLWT